MNFLVKILEDEKKRKRVDDEPDEPTLEEKVENEIGKDSWVKKIVDELEQIKGDLGWGTNVDSNYKVFSAPVEDFSYQGTSYSTREFDYEGVKGSDDGKNRAVDHLVRKQEKKLTDAAQEVIARARELAQANKMYLCFDMQLNDAKNDVKLFRPGFWMFAYEVSGKIEFL